MQKNSFINKKIIQILNSFTKEIVTIFKDNLIGIYLTGSLSYGDFNPGRSDIDLVVILKKSVNTDQLKQIKRLHIQIERQYKKWRKRIECSYLTVDLLQNTLPPKTPRPYYGEGILFPKAYYGNEWLINNYFLYHFGIPLLGPECKTLIKSIAIEDVKKACINDLLQEWKPKINNQSYLNNSHHQAYVILNLCRILYTVINNKLVSKSISTAWVQKEFPEWKDLVQKADNWEYGKEMTLQKEVIKFIKFVVNKLTKI